MSSRHKAKHNTTRSHGTKDSRPEHAKKQVKAYDDNTGGQNEHQQLNSNSDRGQTLGSGPWGQSQALPAEMNKEPWGSGY